MNERFRPLTEIRAWFQRLKNKLNETFTGRYQNQKTAELSERLSKPDVPEFNEGDVLEQFHLLAREKNELELSTDEVEIALNNVRKLYIRFIKGGSRQEQAGLGGGDRRTTDDDDTFREFFTITYDTHSGRIKRASKEYTLGDFSMYRTFVVRKSSGVGSDLTRKYIYHIETEYPPMRISFFESESELDDDVYEDEELETHTNLTIRPVRLDPDEDNNQYGEVVHSVLRMSPEDFLVIRSLEVFNRLFSHIPTST